METYQVNKLVDFQGKAFLAIRARDWQDAINWYSKALALTTITPADRMALLEGRAACYFALGDSVSEAADLREKISLHKHHFGRNDWIDNPALEIGCLHEENLRLRKENDGLFDEVRRQKIFCEMIIANSPAPIISIDNQFKVTGWNLAAEHLFGYKEKEALGRNLNDLVANQPDLNKETAEISRQSIHDDKLHIIAKRAPKDKSLVDVEMMRLPVIMDGYQTGYIIIYHDSIELLQARQEAVEAI